MQLSLYRVILADVINMFRLEGMCGSIKSPLPPFLKRGEHLHFSIATIGVLKWLLSFISSPFDKGGQGDLIKRPIGTYF